MSESFISITLCERAGDKEENSIQKSNFVGEESLSLDDVLRTFKEALSGFGFVNIEDKELILASEEEIQKLER